MTPVAPHSAQFRRVHPAGFAIDLGRTVKEAIELIEKNSGTPCVVVDSFDTCKGVITDGDIRRSLLRGATLESSLAELVKPYAFVEANANASEVAELAKKHDSAFVPCLTAEGKLEAVWVAHAETSSELSGIPVLILAGGRGSRLMPLTSTVPKPLVKVGNTTLLDWSIDKCIDNGFTHFYLSVNYLKEQVISHLETRQGDDFSVHYVEETEPLGTAGPIGLLPENSKGNLLVVNADVLHNVDLANMMVDHINAKRDLTVGLRLHQTTIPFGVVELDGDNIVDVVEKPTLSFPVNAGIYALSQRARDKVSAGDSLDMPDLIKECISAGMNVGSFLAHEFWLDVGTHENLSLAETEIGRWDL